MKNALGLSLLLAASAALAQGGPGPTSGGVQRGNYLRIPDYRTPGDTSVVNYYVDPTGSDTNACTATGTSACLTIQGAINKIPKLLRQQVTVNVAAGTYTAGFIVSGFTADNGVQQTSGGLLIDGALATSTLASGSATGTASAGTAGSGSTFGTLTDAAATWTVNDLKGRFITTASPTNTAVVISSNTATAITVVGTWNAPTASTTYTILDPAVIVSGNATQPATPFQGSSATRTQAGFYNNTLTWNQSLIGVRYMRFSSTNASSGLEVMDNGSYRFTGLQIRPSGAAADGVRVGGSSDGVWPFVYVLGCDISLGTSGSGVNGGHGQIRVGSNLIRNSSAGSGAIHFAGGAGERVESFFVSSNDLSNFTDGVQLYSGFISTSPGLSAGFTGNRITCNSGSGVGINIGSATTTINYVPASISAINNTNIATCGTGVQVIGSNASADIVSLTGAAATTGISAYLGGMAVFTKATTTITAGTNEVNIEGGGATAAFADITAGNCLSVNPQGSRVCGR